MKKAVSKTLIALISLIALVLIVGLILFFVKPDRVAVLAEYDKVSVYNVNTAADRIDLDKAVTGDLSLTGIIDRGLQKSRYNVLQGLLEGKAGTALKFKTKKADDPDNAGKQIDERVELKAEEVKDVRAGETTYKLEFSFAALRTVKVEGAEIPYDRAIVLVHDSANEIDEVEIYFYQFLRIDNESDDEAIGSAYYRVYPVKMRILSTNLFNACKDVIDTARR
ncbi:MAG: hypothetical protein LBH24_00525 [Clostridiales bacterium]|jgi:hypothetical protein|nr:hypothetical protein [Clostridiales bacterium]